MIEKFTLNVVTNLSGVVKISEVEKEKIVYSLASILNELSKFLILLILSLLFSETKLFLIGFITTILLRVVIGGFHLKTYWGCLLFSFFYFLSLIIIYKFDFKIELLILLFLTSSIVIFILSPLVSKQRENISNINNTVYKFIGLLVCSIYLLIYIFTKEPFLRLGLLTVILQSIQLLIMKGVKYYEKNINY